MSLDPEVRRGGNLPFGMFASVWMCDPRYSTNARTLYAILVTYADTHSRDTGRGKPYRVELARQLDASLSTLDRTLDELEVAGLLVVEARVDPENPKKNDANIYHLKDSPLMYADNGEWTDPLPPGMKAADVAKQQTEARRAAKREQGIQRRGGVPKGVNPRAVREGRTGRPGPHGPQKNTPGTGGGGSTHAARGSSMGAARVAAPMLPNVYSPLQNPPPEEPVADAGGKSSGGFARAGARKGAAGENGPERSGSAAPEKSPPPKSPRPKTVRTAPRGMAAGDESVIAAIPPEVCRPGTKPWVGLRRAITDLLTGNPHAGIPPRTPDQVIDRMNRVWHQSRGPERSAPGYTSTTGMAGDARITNKSSWLAAAILHQDCPDPGCEEGVLIPDGDVCKHCSGRDAEERAAQEAAIAAVARINADRVDAESRKRQDRQVVAAYVESAAAEEEGVRGALRAAGVWGTMLDHRVAQHMARWRNENPAPAPAIAGAPV